MQDDERLSRVLPNSRNPHDVLYPIATGLTQQPWDGPSLRAYLKMHLPRPLLHLAAPMARTLLCAFPGTAAPDTGHIIATLGESGSGLRLRAFARQTGTRPQPVLTPPTFLPTSPFADLGLPELTSCAALEDWLALPTGQLIRFADLRNLSALSSDPFGPHYRHHLIPKSDGRLRLIEEPKPMLKRLQRRILHGLIGLIPVHSAACGFVSGRSAIKGATRHAGEEMVIAFDLAHFFSSIPFVRIYSLFRTIGYPAEVARHLAALTTSLTPQPILKTPNLAAADILSGRHLPQGAPTSPALANLCALSLDRRLSGLAWSVNATYTRYADDLTFSGDAQIAPLLLRAVPQIIADAGFHPNPAKTRTMPAWGRQTVTGLIVNQRVNIPRRSFDQLKAVIHHLSRPTDARRGDAGFLMSLSGQIAWVERVHPSRGHRLRNALANALAQSLAATDLPPA
jgi:RNA-directed DNA polymerase